jgi:hypothetical protein
MPTIIAPSGNNAHANPDQAARLRADRLAKATPEQTETALAYLSAIDPRRSRSRSPPSRRPATRPRKTKSPSPCAAGAGA